MPRPVVQLKVELPIEPVPVQTQTVRWLPQWSWVFDDAFAKAEPVEDEPYSTFPPGHEPDVWPQLPQPSSQGGIVVVVMSGVVALLFGTMLVRWQSSRIRITRRRHDYGAAGLSGQGYRQSA